MDRENVIKGVHDARRYLEDREWVDKSVGVHIDALNDVLALLKDEKEYCDKCVESAIKTTVELQEEIARLRSLLKEQEAKQYNNHEVACIIADLFGDPCACNFNDIDTWLPYKCDFRETCCPNTVGVACWEQYLKHKEGR